MIPTLITRDGELRGSPMNLYKSERFKGAQESSDNRSLEGKTKAENSEGDEQRGVGRRDFVETF